MEEKKRRGRPVGSKNKPKTEVAGEPVSGSSYGWVGTEGATNAIKSTASIALAGGVHPSPDVYPEGFNPAHSPTEPKWRAKPDKAGCADRLKERLKADTAEALLIDQPAMNSPIVSESATLPPLKFEEVKAITEDFKPQRYSKTVAISGDLVDLAAPPPALTKDVLKRMDDLRKSADTIASGIAALTLNSGKEVIYRAGKYHEIERGKRGTWKSMKKV